MAIVISTALRDLLAAKGLRAMTLCEVYLDDGTVYLTDDNRIVEYGGNDYLVANFVEMSSVRTASDLASESLNIKIDSARLLDNGVPVTIVDEFMTALLEENVLRRRLNFYIGVAAVNEEHAGHRIPLYAGYITNTPVQADPEGPIVIDFQLDSIAERYNETTSLLRTDESHQSVYDGDLFYQYTSQLVGAEQELYWGKSGPTTPYVGGGISGIGNGHTGAYWGTNLQLF